MRASWSGPNLSAMVWAALIGLNPVAAVLINNGSAIVAEMNGFRPLLGPPGWDQRKAQRQGVASEGCGDGNVCNYNFDLPVEPEPLMGLVLRMIEENGGTVTGAFPAVSVSIPTSLGRVEGRCRLVKDRLVNIQVTKKPDFMTCQMVREKLIFILSEAVKKSETGT